MKIEAEDLRVLVSVLRVLRKRTQEEMAAAAGLHPSTLCRYEDGKRTPERPALEKLAQAAGVPMWGIDGVLLPALAVVRRLSTGTAARPAEDPAGVLAAVLATAPSAAAGAGIAEFLAEGDGACAADESTAVAVAAADAALKNSWPASEPAPAATPAAELQAYQQFENLCERLCAESVRAAADHAGRALELARIALLIADLAPGPAAWRTRLQGHATGFVANAQRVGSDLPAAEASFASAWTAWRSGAAAPGTRLGEWRLLDLEASLRRAQRRFGPALELLERALAAAPAAARGRILLNKGFTLEQGGETEAALAALEEAAPLVDAAGDRQLAWTVRINRLVIICHLGRHAEAETGLPELDRLARELGNDLDGLRAQWLKARVWAGLGRAEDARAAFDEVRREFTRLRNGYDTALVSLELAILHLEAGRSAEVRALAEEMLWIFSAQGVHREALAALSLFCRVAESDTVTLGLARRVLASLASAERGARASFDDAS